MVSSFQPLAPSNGRAFYRAATATTNTASAPVVLLLGWADAPLKYVQKYADIYPPESAVLVQLSRFTDFLCSDRALASLVTPIIDWLHVHQPTQTRLGPTLPSLAPPNPRPSGTAPPASCPPTTPPLPPVVIHLFSNGGALLLHALQVAAARASTRLQILGITIDSAPSEGSVIDGAKLISRVAAGGGPFQYLLFVLIVIGMLLHRLARALTGQPTLFRSIWQALSNTSYSCTRLVLYSEADVLVASRMVDKFVVYARGKGIQVVANKWKDSPHVRHYVDHADEYRALVHEHVVAPACKRLTELQ